LRAGNPVQFKIERLSERQAKKKPLALVGDGGFPMHFFL
jgi:hypothetical protein